TSIRQQSSLLGIKVKLHPMRANKALWRSLINCAGFIVPMIILFTCLFGISCRQPVTRPGIILGVGAVFRAGAILGHIPRAIGAIGLFRADRPAFGRSRSMIRIARL